VATPSVPPQAGGCVADIATIRPKLAVAGNDRRVEVYPIPRVGHPLRASLGLADKFVAMYSGNLGMAHSATEFLDAARRLRDRTRVREKRKSLDRKGRKVKKNAIHEKVIPGLRFLRLLSGRGSRVGIGDIFHLDVVFYRRTAVASRLGEI